MNCSHANFRGLCERCLDNKGTYKDEILINLEKLRRHPMTALETRSLKLKAKNEMLDEVINEIKKL